MNDCCFFCLHYLQSFTILLKALQQMLKYSNIHIVSGIILQTPRNFLWMFQKPNVKAEEYRNLVNMLEIFKHFITFCWEINPHNSYACSNFMHSLICPISVQFFYEHSVIFCRYYNLWIIFLTVYARPKMPFPESSHVWYVW